MKMKSKLFAATFVVAALATLGFAASAGAAPAAKLPRGFFGIAPQTVLGPEDVRYMRAGGIESVRVAFPWAGIQPTRFGGYDWSVVDPTIEVAARGGLEVLPFLAGTPKWLGRTTALPVSGRKRAAWIAFVKAAAKRYGPGGEFWRERRTAGIDYEAIPRPKPLRHWQIWNEANFFYFAFPVSPARYAKLLRITARALKSVQPGAKIVLSGLFGKPNARGRKGMPAAEFLERLYRVPGFRNQFDSVALHPYAIDARELEEMVEELSEVTTENRDRPGLFVTEMGWGSQNNFSEVAFEQGKRGQARQLRKSYGFLIENARRLNLKQVHWFSWKDAPLLCNFCDSVGLFRQGAKFRPKPAWHSFVRITGGRARP